MMGFNQREREPYGALIFVLFAYSLLIFVVDTVLVAGLPWRWTRADLMMAVCVEVAGRYPFWGAILWSLLWGYVSDVFQGRLWGVHVVSYVLVVILHRLWSAQMDTGSMFYRMLLVGLGVVVQSLMSALIVGGLGAATAGFPLTGTQAVFSILAAPFVMLPIQWIMAERDR